ncbi:MAG TPA: glycosyltransferase [Thermomicrobiales bacterium]|nr:glycosyltransferase [Thermomicrobiales bacterium]
MANDSWRSLFERSIDAYYDGAFTEGRAACETLLSLPDLPDDIHALTRQNLRHYAQPLTALAPATAYRALDIPVTPGWSRFNPSIAAGPEGFRVIVRSSNYWLECGVPPELGRFGRTVNYLAELDPGLELVAVTPIADETDQAGRFPHPVRDFEDCRLTRWGDAWFAVAAARDRNPDYIYQMALLRLDDGAFRDLRLLSDWESGRHQKNWVPLPVPREPLLLASASPTVVVRYDEVSERVEEMSRRPAPAIARHFRGSSQAVALDDGYLYIVHETVVDEASLRTYLHRWVRLDRHCRITHVSPQFFFLYRGTEFCAGLARRGGELVVSFGVRDREAYLATLPLAEALACLAPPLPPASAIEPNGHVVANGFEPLAPSFEEPAASAPSLTISLSAPLADGLVSTTLTGNSRELIGDALRSVVDWVDACLLIDTGITDDTIAAARAVAGDKLIVRHFPWRDDFAAARNFALEAAADLGAAWAVTIDTDERLALGDLDIRAWLRETAADAIHLLHANGTYGKQRFFRLPAHGRWEGPTHEAYGDAGGTPVTLPRGRFTEIVKSEADYRHKFERDLAILERQVAERPDDPRWRYYLGDALQNLERYEDAIAAYRACWRLRGWDEEGAWAMYRAAQCWLALDRPDDAIEACAAGMARHAGLAELPWMAGYAAYQAGRDAQAIYWAQLAASLGVVEGCAAGVPRIGFRRPFAQYEGPFDILRFAYRRQGDDAAADDAERRYEDARRRREEAGLPD